MAEDMFEVVTFNDKTFGIRQIKTGMFAGADGKVKSFKKKGAAVLFCADMNQRVAIAKAALKEEHES